MLHAAYRGDIQFAGSRLFETVTDQHGSRGTGGAVGIVAPVKIDEWIPCILESDESWKKRRKNWASLIQKIYENATSQQISGLLPLAFTPDHTT
jgi:hypothetical protein